jgi:hypothetical protein
MTKHKHAEVIHAWANGAEVQVKWESVGWQDSKDPAWFTEWEYRIKPAPPKREWVGLTDEDISKAKTLLKDNDPDYAIFFIMTRLQEYNT